MMLIALLLALQQTATPTPPPPRRAAPTTLSIDIRVTDRSGRPISDVSISADGPTLRDGQTDARGALSLRGLTPGLYRIRAEVDQFITLEKEVTIRGTIPPMQFALARAPAPPAPPPPPPAPPPPPPVAPAIAAGAPGEPRVVSVPDLAEKSLSGREAVKVVSVACSGTSNVRLIMVRDVLPLASHKEESQTLYMVSGQASLTIGDARQTLEPGWVGVVPRGVPYGLEKKGRNPAVLLSVTAGLPCEAAPVAAAR